MDVPPHPHGAIGADLRDLLDRREGATCRVHHQLLHGEIFEIIMKRAFLSVTHNYNLCSVQTFNTNDDMGMHTHVIQESLKNELSLISPELYTITVRWPNHALSSLSDYKRTGNHLFAAHV